MKNSTSWESVGKWYQEVVGEKGHYYHEQVIFPNLKRILNLKPGDRVLDLGCGQGVLARNLAAGIDYLGIDMATNLVEIARIMDTDTKHQYMVADVTHELKLKTGFSHGVILFALQNMKSPFKAIRNVSKLLNVGGKLVIVLNHPAFRIPKHSDWVVLKNKQYRIVEKYLTPQEIPIESSPFDNRDNRITWSYHLPISTYTEMLFDNGLLIETMEEWVSDKKSTGRMAKTEDDARKEFPLFLAIVARKREKI